MALASSLHVGGVCVLSHCQALEGSAFKQTET